MKGNRLALVVGASVLACAAWAGHRAYRIVASSRVAPAAEEAALAPADAKRAESRGVASATIAAPDGDAAKLALHEALSTRYGPETGDPDSFGRPVRWLGLMPSANFVFQADCSGASPADTCVTLEPNTGNANYTGTIAGAQTLPGNSVQSLLCHWATTSMFINFRNASGPENREVYVRLLPSVVFQNPALNLPNHVDPDTGQPMAGSITLYMSSTSVSTLLDTGEAVGQRNQSSRTCIGGYLSRSVLKNYYGLSDAEVRAVFASSSTLTLNMTVSARGVSDGSAATYGLRWVGD